MIWALSRGVTSGDRPVRGRTAGSRDTVQRAAHTAGMPVRLHHIVVDAHDLPGLARFWTQALGWKVLSERENEIVIGTDENAPAGMCFMPVTDPKTVKNRVHLDPTSSAADRDQEIDRLLAPGARRADIGQAGAESWTVLADQPAREGATFAATQSRQNSLPSMSCITRHDSLPPSAGSSRTRTAPSATSRAHSASSAARRSSPASPVPPARQDAAGS